MIYLDHQASTPVLPNVLQAMLPHFSEQFANPHSAEHAAGWAAGDAVEAARQAVAKRIGSDASEIIFTSGATEANNIAILGAADASGGRKRIVVSAIEHKSVLAPARELEARGFDLVVAKVDANGQLDLSSLEKIIDHNTLLVSVMHTNNEIGTVHPLEKVAEICARSGAILHTDCAQALSWSSIDVHELGVGLLSLSAHKAGGPKGIGALFVRHDMRSLLRPLVHGGEQEGGLRAGTVPTALCVGLGVACEQLPTSQAIEEWRKVTASLRDSILDLVPAANLIGSRDLRHPGNLCFRIPGVDAEQLISVLQPDVAISRGSACTSGIPEPSHVLRAVGLDAQECSEAIRLSTGINTTQAEVVAAANAIAEAAKMCCLVQ